MQVTIRPLEEHDAYTSVHWRNDKDVFKYTGNIYDHVITINSELNWIKKVIVNNQLGKEYRCAIMTDGVYVGNIYLTDIDSFSAQYHIFIGDKNYWGKGIAKQASLLILDYAFKTLKLKNVHLNVCKDNIGAYKLYQKIGFEYQFEKDSWITMTIRNESFNYL